MTDSDVIADILRREGGYADHHADHGGPTQYGVTQATLAAWRGQPVTVDDVRTLTEAEAAAIYQQRYVIAPGFTAIQDPALRGLLVDFGVHSGPARAIKALQQALGGLHVDGVLGSLTLEALRRADPVVLYKAVLTRRVLFVADLAMKDRSQLVFLKGWLARCCEFL